MIGARLATLDVGSNLHLQFEVESDDPTGGSASQAQDGLPQMSGRPLDGTAFVDQTLESGVEVKTTFAIWTIREVLLHDSNFLGAQFAIKIEMETSNGLDAT